MGDEGEPKRMFGFRAEEPLAEKIDEYAEDNDLNESDALRYLVRQGLETTELTEKVEELEQRINQLERASA